MAPHQISGTRAVAAPSVVAARAGFSAHCVPRPPGPGSRRLCGVSVAGGRATSGAGGLVGMFSVVHARRHGLPVCQLRDVL